VTPPAAGWEPFDVEADVGIRAWAATPADAFAQAALGVLGLAVAPEEVEARETREVRAQGETPEDLLVNWLNECLYVHEIEGFAVHRVEVAALEDRLVHGLLHGEPLDPRRHHTGTLVKAATSHQVSVRTTPQTTEVRVIVDV
jgi:SHS2 domain-containing protein